MWLNKALSFLVLVFAFYACSTIPGTQKITLLDFQKVKGIDLGSTQTVIHNLFGKPTQIFQIPLSNNEVIWLYQAGKFNATRASFIFDSTSGRLLSKTWEVRDGDPEQKLEIVFQHFGNGNFSQREAEWINPHAAPDEIYYENKNLGLSIEVRKLRQEVVAITWFDPRSRSVAKNTQQSCIKSKKSIGLISCRSN